MLTKWNGVCFYQNTCSCQKMCWRLNLWTMLPLLRTTIVFDTSIKRMKYRWDTNLINLKSNNEQTNQQTNDKQREPIDGAATTKSYKFKREWKAIERNFALYLVQFSTTLKYFSKHADSEMIISFSNHPNWYYDMLN